MIRNLVISWATPATHKECQWCSHGSDYRALFVVEVPANLCYGADAYRARGTHTLMETQISRARCHSPLGSSAKLSVSNSRFFVKSDFEES